MTRAIVTFLGLGLLRPAPGTWGSAGAVLIAWTIDRAFGFPVLVLFGLAVTALGFAAIARALAGKPGEDPAEIVIDEVAGQTLALALPAALFWLQGWEGWLPWPAALATFAFFRLFDIWKPWLVGRADRRGDAVGVMLDDLWAGLFAGLATILLGVLWHIPLVLGG